MRENNKNTRLSWMSLTAAFLAATSEACVQVTLESIANTNGRITDYETSEDELYVWMGISQDVMITWKNTIVPWEKKSFSPGIVTMPCFHDSVLWLEMEEQDQYQIDKTQIAMACKNLQLGQNKLITHIEENNAGISNGADVINGTIGTSFKFGSENTDKTAQYTFTFNVEQNCSLRPDQAAFTSQASTPGEVEFMSNDILTVLKPKMDAEYVNPAPPPPPIFISPEPPIPEPPIPEPEVLVLEPEIVIKEEAPVIVDVPAPVEIPEPVIEVVEPEPEPEIETSEQDLDIIEIQPAGLVDEEEKEPATEETNNGELKDIDFNTFSKDIPSGGEQTTEDAEEEVLQVVLSTGDKIDLETDVEEDQFSSFTSFKSTQFFVTEFERSSGLLTQDDEEAVTETSWFEDDGGVGVPNWVLILICSLVILFSLLAIYICIQMRRNKSERDLQERAIIRELQMAKQEGVEIPDDLEKRLERFQSMDENGVKKGNQKEGGQQMKSGPIGKGEMKVHPDSSNPSSDNSSPDRKLNRNLTRYGGSGMNVSQNTALSNSQSKLIRNKKTDDGYGARNRGPLSSPFFQDESTMQRSGNVGIIEQPIDDLDMDIKTVRKSLDGLNVSQQRKSILGDCHLESIEIREESRQDINDI